jgi:hypothetical protein
VSTSDEVSAVAPSPREEQIKDDVELDLIDLTIESSEMQLSVLASDPYLKGNNPLDLVTAELLVANTKLLRRILNALTSQ